MTDLGRPRGSVASAIASSAVATSAVLALLVGLNFGFGQSADGASDPGGAAAQADLTDDAGSTAYGPAPILANPTAAATGTATTPAAPAREPAAAHPAAPAVPNVTVVVLNQTVRRGLAEEFRTVLADAGWHTGGVGNFRGNVPATTVYYPKGMKPEATALARQFDQVDRIRPAFPGIPGDKLTVILCKDYPRT